MLKILFTQIFQKKVKRCRDKPRFKNFFMEMLCVVNKKAKIFFTRINLKPKDLKKLWIWTTKSMQLKSSFVNISMFSKNLTLIFQFITRSITLCSMKFLNLWDSSSKMRILKMEFQLIKGVWFMMLTQ